MSPKSTKLVEGVDYYVEGGRLVFTAEYHLKRGHCCNSGCRHCPYRGDVTSSPTLQILVPGPRKA